MMMGFAKKTVHAVAFSFAMLGMPALALAQVTKPVAEGLMRQSGLWEQLAAIGPQIEAGVGAAAQQSGKSLTAEESKSLTQAFSAAYSPLHLRSTALGVIAAGLTPTDVAALQAWYGSSNGQAITQLEEAASREPGDPQARVQAGVKALSGAPADRKALLVRLTQVTRAAEVTVDIIINSAVGIQEGLARTLPAADRAGAAAAAKEARAAFEQQKPQMTKHFESAMVALFAATYEKLDDAALGQYIDFLKSPAGSAYTDLSIRALNRAFVQAGQALGRSMPAIKSNTNL